MDTLAWPMEAEETMQVLRSIQFKYFKWDIFHRGDTSIIPDALVLTDDEHRYLVDAAESSYAALMEVESQVASDPDLLDLVGVPQALHDPILRQPDDHPRVTRCDFHLTARGQWMISEFNSDDTAGFAESYGLAQVLGNQWRQRFKGLGFRGDLRRAICDSFQDYPRIGLLHATAYSEDLQHVALVERWLQDEGHDTVIGAPSNLSMVDDQPHVLDSPVDAVFRYYPGEWLVNLPNFDAWQAASPKLASMNPLSAVASHSKRCYALWQGDAVSLSDEARSTLNRFFPPSQLLEDLDRAEILNNPNRWVLKGAYGRTGDTVRIGPLMPKEAWTKAVNEAFDQPQNIVAQKRFEMMPMWTSRGLSYPTVGVFLVDGKFAGYFSRVDRGPLIGYDSWHVPTLVSRP